MKLGEFGMTAVQVALAIGGAWALSAWTDWPTLACVAAAVVASYPLTALVAVLRAALTD